MATADSVVRRSDAGLTLVELVMAITITSVIIGAVAMSFSLALNTTGAADDRMSESSVSQLAARYFVPDIQSGMILGSGDSAPDDCDNASALVRLLVPGSSGSGSFYVTYSVVGKELRRTVCSGSSSSSISLGDDVNNGLIDGPSSTGVVRLEVVTTSGRDWSVQAQRRLGRSVTL